jgi:hypothetical protein
VTKIKKKIIFIKNQERKNSGNGYISLKKMSYEEVMKKL